MRERKHRWFLIPGAFILSWIVLAGCCHTTGRVSGNPDNLCDVFTENERWYEGAARARERWGVSIPVIMAIMHQESKFDAEAKPPRTTCLFIIPGPRPSSAYGYAQALDDTWDVYRKATGNTGADRNDFADAADFIGWYCAMSYARCGIDKGDVYNLYLAYHEGWGGYSRKTHRSKQWLLAVAGKVLARKKMYENQLASCEARFVREKGCCLWPF